MTTPTLPEGVRLEQGEGGLERLAVETDRASAQVYLLGAHVATFTPRDHDPVLFMSGSSRFEVGQPIRGGVPICFPWFGMRSDRPELPGHGLVRQALWSLNQVDRGPDGAVNITLSKQADDATREIWPRQFRIVHRITIADQLTMALEVTNSGGAAFTFEEALHTYLHVADVRHVKVHGLENADYTEKAGGVLRQANQGPGPVTIHGETDRVYSDTTAACVLEDLTLERKITITKSNSHTTVVWNPWIDKAQRMPDFGAGEWPEMLCIETANSAGHAVHLDAGASHTMTAQVRVDRG